MATDLQERTSTAQQQPDVTASLGGQAAQAQDQDQLTEAIQAMVQAKVEAAIQQKQAQAVTQVGEPAGWVDIYASGPYQPGAGTVPPSGMLSRPLKPHSVIRAGEHAWISATLVLNPNPLPQDPGIIPTDFLSGFKLPYVIEFMTMNLTTGDPEPTLTAKREGYLKPHRSEYTEVFRFKAQKRGCIFETNVCFRVLDCHKSSPSYSPLAGFATWVYNYDDASFLDNLLGIPNAPTQPGYQFNTPIRFMTYD